MSSPRMVPCRACPSLGVRTGSCMGPSQRERAPRAAPTCIAILGLGTQSRVGWPESPRPLLASRVPYHPASG